METSTTPKILQSRRPRSLRPSPSSSFKSPLIKTETAISEQHPDLVRNHLTKNQLWRPYHVLNLSKKYPFEKGVSKKEKKVSVQFENASVDDMKKATLKLWQENEDLKKAISELEQQGYEESQLKWYIDKLHEYNEIKDIAQMVMGRIAVIELKTVREVHEDFGMKDDD